MMSPRRIACILTSFPLVLPVIVLADTNIVTAKKSLYEKFAPLVWLASDERIYPMMPHPFAFDGMDNDLDDLKDLEDPKEIRMDEKELLDLIDLVEHLRGFEFTVDIEAARLKRVVDSADPKRSDQTGPKFDLSALETDSPELRGIFQSYGQPLSDYIRVTNGRVHSHIYLTYLGSDWWEILTRAIDDADNKKSLVENLRKKKVLLDLSPTTIAYEGSGDSVLILTQLKNASLNDSTVKYYLKRVLGKDGQVDRVNVYGDGHYEYEIHVENTAIRVVHKSLLPHPRVTCALSSKRIKKRDVYEYWFYYLFDIGAGGHVHDGEHAFVFVDALLNRVDGVAGAGHTQATPNNIVVTSNEPRTRRIFPKGLPNHMPILVELGKHASAPDRAFDGRFDLGMDANMFYRDVWGSRDIAAASGVDLIRHVTPELSFPRDFSSLIVEKNWKAEAIRLGYQAEEVTRKSRSRIGPVVEAQKNRPETPESKEQMQMDLEKTLIIPDSVGQESEPYEATDLAIFTAYKPQASRLGDGCDTYSIFPLEKMERLVSTLKTVQSREALQQWLSSKENKIAFWGKDTVKVSINQAGFEALEDWHEEPHANRDLWLHTDHQHPGNVFKLWLFPNSSIGLSFMALGQEATSRVSWNHSNIFGRLFPNSFVELYADYDLLEGDSGIQFTDFGLNYRFFKGSHQGLYAGFGRGGGLDSRGYPYLTFGCVPISWTVIGHTQFSLMTELRADIDTRPATWAVSPFRTVIGLSLAHSLFGPKHPLDY